MSDETHIEQIYELIVRQLGVKRQQIEPSSDLVLDLGCEGDDCVEFLEEYSARFAVNIDGYLWYFHHGVEGFSLWWMLFGPPWRHIKPHIAITPAVLLAGAKEGRWMVKYPPHKPVLFDNGFVTLMKEIAAMIIAVLALLPVIWLFFTVFG